MNLFNDYDSAKVLVLFEGMSSDELIIDLGCTFHMTPRKDLFLDLKHVNWGERS